MGLVLVSANIATSPLSPPTVRSTVKFSSRTFGTVIISGGSVAAKITVSVPLPRMVIDLSMVKGPL